MSDIGNVKSAERVLFILEYFAEKRRPQRANEIAQSLGIPISSCMALLLTMVARDVLVYDNQGKTYAPTSKLRELSNWMQVEDGLEQKAIRSARRLHRELGQPVAVCRRSGLFIEWLYTLDVTKLHVGERRPVFQTVNGLALLAGMTDCEIETLVEAHNERFGRQGSVTFAEVLRRVRVMPARGYVSGSSALVPGLASICFVVKDENSDEELLIAVQVNASDLSRREPVIVQTARRILPGLMAA